MSAAELLGYANYLPIEQRAAYIASLTAIANSVNASGVNTADLSTGGVKKQVAISDTDILQDTEFTVEFDNTANNTATDVVLFDWIGLFDNPTYLKATGGTFNGQTANILAKFAAAKNVVVSSISFESLTKGSLGTMVQNWKFYQGRIDKATPDYQPIRFSFPTNQDSALVLTGVYNSDNLVISGITALVGRVAANDKITLRFTVSAVERAFIGNA